jgi:hypothetical protein
MIPSCFLLLLDVAGQVSFSIVARGQIPGDYAPWYQTYQGWTKVWRNALPTIGKCFRVPANLDAARLKWGQYIVYYE